MYQELASPPPQHEEPLLAGTSSSIIVTTLRRPVGVVGTTSSAFCSIAKSKISLQCEGDPYDLCLTDFLITTNFICNQNHLLISKTYKTSAPCPEIT